MNSADFPCKDAHFILTDAATDGTIALPARSADGKLFVAERRTDQRTDENGAARGTYRIAIRICIPNSP